MRSNHLTWVLHLVPRAKSLKSSDQAALAVHAVHYVRNGLAEHVNKDVSAPSQGLRLLLQQAACPIFLPSHAYQRWMGHLMVHIHIKMADQASGQAG